MRQLIGCGCIIVSILLSLISSGARAQSSSNQKLLKDPIGNFVFDASLGNPAPPITVYYYRPNQIDPGTRVVFLMHGSSRTAQEARDLGAVYGKKHNFILLAPEFSERNYPGDTYAFGNMLGPDGKLLPESMWAFATIERVFDRVREELRLRTATYDIVGHSAGGQLVHRLVLFAPHLRFRRAVASSPGRDTDDRVRETEAMSQGSNRFARGLRFFAIATEEANLLKVALAWRLRIAYGVDHSPRSAVQAGFEELLR